LALALARAHRLYSGFVNARARRTGHVFYGRYGSVAMDEAHLIAAARYVALNPVRARLVADARDWPHSSVAAHLVGRDDGITIVRPILDRVANFADLLAYGSSYQIYDPATTKPSTTAGRYTRSTFPGNVVPQSRLSQTALNIIAAYYPLPNLPGAKPTGVNYTMPSIQANDFDNHAFRLDHAIGQKHRLFVRATVNQRAQAQQLRFAGGAGYNGERDNQHRSTDLSC